MRGFGLSTNEAQTFTELIQLLEENWKVRIASKLRLRKIKKGDGNFNALTTFYPTKKLSSRPSTIFRMLRYWVRLGYYKEHRNHGSEVWPVKVRAEQMRNATEIDFCRWLAGIFWRNKITNQRVWEIMESFHNFTHNVKAKQLVWYSHGQGMSNDQRQTDIVLDTNWREMMRKAEEKMNGKELIRAIERESEGDQWRLSLGKQRKSL